MSDEIRRLADCPRYGVTPDGKVFSFNKDGSFKLVAVTVCRAHLTATPYRMVTLSRQGKSWCVKVACLLMTLYGPPRPTNRHCVCHCDGDSLHDHIDNLYWGTYTENNNDRIRHGTMPYGTKHPNAKLSEQSVSELKEAHRRGESKSSLAKRYSISATLAGRIIRGLAWPHVA